MQTDTQNLKKTATPEQVCDVVKRHLRRLGTLRDAQEQLGIAPQTISGHLSGSRYLSRKIAKRFSEAYGFDVDYLTTGEGFPFGENDSDALRQPASYSIDLPDEAARYELEMLRAGEEVGTQRLNSSVFRAMLSMTGEMNGLRDRWLSLAESVKDIAGMLKRDSEEYQLAMKTIQAIMDSKIPKL